MLLAWYDTDVSASGIKWPKINVALHFNCLDLRNTILPFLMPCHQVIPTPVPMLNLFLSILTKQCSGAIDDTIGIIWCWHQLHHMTKKSCYFSFDHLDLTNGMLPLMTLLASCDTVSSIIGITWPKSYVAPHFKYLDEIKYSGVIDDAIGIIWCWC